MPSRAKAACSACAKVMRARVSAALGTVAWVTLAMPARRGSPPGTASASGIQVAAVELGDGIGEAVVEHLRLGKHRGLVGAGDGVDVGEHVGERHAKAGGQVLRLGAEGGTVGVHQASDLRRQRADHHVGRLRAHLRERGAQDIAARDLGAARSVDRVGADVGDQRGAGRSRERERAVAVGHDRAFIGVARCHCRSRRRRLSPPGSRRRQSSDRWRCPG